MQVFVAQIETRRTRIVRFAAKGRDNAGASAAVLLRPGDRIVSIEPEGSNDPLSARAALDHMLSRDYLQVGREMHSVSDWIGMAIEDPDATNPKIALAGLRVVGTDLAVGSPVSIPLLHDWFQDTPWSGPALLQTLMALPDARRSNFTFAGRAARGVLLPLTVALEAS